MRHFGACLLELVQTNFLADPNRCEKDRYVQLETAVGIDRGAEGRVEVGQVLVCDGGGLEEAEGCGVV